MSSSGPDLFVVCKNCQSEVSPYITECPYCGSRLRKRAPKIDREGNVQEKPGRAPRGARGARRPPRKRPSAPALGRLRRGEIPGVRGDRRPYVTLALVAASLVLLLVVRSALLDLLDFIVFGPLGGEWWRVFTTPFAYDNSGYAFAALTAIAIFGWLLERRHGFGVVLGLFLLGGAGGALAAVGIEGDPLALGGNGAALAMIGAWIVPDLQDARGGEEVEGDLIGAGVFAAVLLLLPLVVPEANAITGIAGLLVGLVVGHPLARLARR